MRRRLCCQGAAAAQARQQRPPRSSYRPYSPGRAELWVPAPHRKSRSAPHWRSERHTTGRTLRRLPDRVPAPHRKSRSAPHWRSERHTTGRTLRRLPDLRRSTVALQKTFHLQKRLHRVRLWCSNESPRFFLEEEKRKKRKVCGLRSKVQEMNLSCYDSRRGLSYDSHEDSRSVEPTLLQTRRGRRLTEQDADGHNACGSVYRTAASGIRWIRHGVGGTGGCISVVPLVNRTLEFVRACAEHVLKDVLQ